MEQVSMSFCCRRGTHKLEEIESQIKFCHLIDVVGKH